MKEQLRLLRLLQSQDAQVKEMFTVLSTLPKQLADAKRALAEMEKRFEKEKQTLAETETFYKSQEEEQKNLAQQIAKSKSRLSQVRNAKETNALQREIDTNRRALDLREEELKRLSDALLEQKTRIVFQEEKLAKYTQELAIQEAESQARLKELEEKAQQAQFSRIEFTEKILPVLLKQYETLRKNQRWPMMASASQSICSICRIQISPQIYNNLYRGDSVETCTSCHRILYLPQMLEESSETG